MQAGWVLALLSGEVTNVARAEQGFAGDPWWLSSGEASAAPRCLTFAVRLLGEPASYGEVARKFPRSAGRPTLDDLEITARQLGVHPVRYQGEPAKLGFSPFPVIVSCRAGDLSVYRVIYGRTADGQRLKIFEAPAKLRELDHRYFGHSYQGQALIVAPYPIADVNVLLHPPWRSWRRPLSWLVLVVTLGALLGPWAWRRT